MNGWNDGISNAIAYIEEHLTEEIDINEVAGQAFVSSFYFQKIFNVLCGFTVGEYIRNRRLTLAAQELCARVCSEFCCTAENKTYTGGWYNVRVQDHGKGTVYSYGSFTPVQ